MNIEQKPDEEIYAQTAAYAYEQPIMHQQALMKNLGGVATQLVAGETVTTEEKKWDGQIETMEHTSESYVDFLRKADPETRTNIAYLTDRIQKFSEYAEDVDEALADANKDSDHYLGAGANGKAFKFSRDGEDYAVKTGGVSYFNISAFRKGEVIEGISHLKAVDLDRNIAVMNLVSGTMPEKMSKEDMLAIPEEHISAVINKAIAMHEAGLAIDPKPSNFLYDKQEGFGVIDYHDQAGKGTAKHTVSEQVVGLGVMLTKYDAGTPPKYGTPESEQFYGEMRDHSITMYGKFLDVLEAEHPDILAEAAEHQQQMNVDPRTYTLGQFGDVYSMPEGEPYDSYKARIITLGLDGQKPREVTVDDDLDVVDYDIQYSKPEDEENEDFV